MTQHYGEDDAVRVHSPADDSRSSNDVDKLDSTTLTSRLGLSRTRSALSTNTPVVYKVYKRRFFGLIELILLNFVGSMGWTCLTPISDTVAQYFDTSESAINWLSIVFFFAYVVVIPAVFWTLNYRGPKTSIVISAILLLIGNWVKYAGTKTNHFPVVMLGQIFIGFSQPFALSVPTMYSNLWFTGAGRTTATAFASLANPLGAAIGQLVAPFWVSSASDVPNVVLYTAVIATGASLPAFFLPSQPPTPPTAAVPSNTDNAPPLFTQLRKLLTSLEFYLVFIPFSVYVGFFNAFASLVNQILQPYGFSDDDAGLAGGLLILVGLVWAIILSPFIDRFKFYLAYIKLAVPMVAIMYLVFIWAPPSRNIVFVYVVCAIQGAVSFGLVPVTLEFLVEIYYPLGPETSSTLMWTGGQLLGGVFTIIMDHLKSNKGGPPNNMQHALIFQAVLSLVVMPLPIMLGWFGRSAFVTRKRWEVEQRPRNSADFENEAEDEVRVLANDRNGNSRV